MILLLNFIIFHFILQTLYKSILFHQKLKFLQQTNYCRVTVGITQYDKSKHHI